MQTLNLANRITLARICVVPLIVLLLYFEGPFVCILATILFALACITDLIDGHIARKENMVTNFGKFLDPLADKLLISSVLVMFSTLNWVPAWVTILIICREFMVTGLRAVAVESGIILAADKYGKLKTVFQMLAIVPLMIHYPTLGFNPILLGQILLYIALVLTLVSGYNYLHSFYKQWQMDVHGSHNADAPQQNQTPSNME